MAKKLVGFVMLALSFYSGLGANQHIDCKQLRSHNGKSIKAFIGFVDLIEGAEELIKSQSEDPILGVQHLMDGVASLIEASIEDALIDVDGQVNLIEIINNFKCQIDTLVQNNQFKVASDSDVERRKLMEGLAAILYHAVYMLIDPKSMGTCLTNILGGVYKVVSSILADGKIDCNDWNKLLGALASIFNLSQGRIFQVHKTVIYNLDA